MQRRKLDMLTTTSGVAFGVRPMEQDQHNQLMQMVKRAEALGQGERMRTNRDGSLTIIAADGSERPYVEH